MTLTLRWRRPDPPITLAWRGPDDVMVAAIAADPMTSFATIIGPPGPKGDPGSNGVQSVSGGNTGLTPATATGGVVTLGGTLNAAHGGTGATALTGYVKGAGQDAFTAVPGIPASDISTPIDCGTFN